MPVSDDLVNARPADVRKLAKSLEQFGQKMAQASKEANRAIGAAYWHDSQKDRFEARYRDLQKRVNGFVSSEVRDMVTSLNRLAADLERVRGHRF